MLDEAEFREASRLYGAMFKTENAGRTIQERSVPLIDYHERITGVRETNPNAILHHGLELYGPPCAVCTRPYRTPRARFCVSCGNERQA